LPDFGVVLANAGVVSGSTTVDELLAIAHSADADPSWDYVWVGDSIASTPRFESVVLLAALAAATDRIRLGVGCLASMGYRQPLVLANQWTSLDVLSAGRITLVACPGASKGPAADREHTAFAMDHATKVARMESAIELLRRVTGDGREAEMVTADPTVVAPLPIQRPLPIWMVANPTAAATPAAVERALRRVVRLGDGWMTFGLPPTMVRERVDLLHRLRTEAGQMDDSAYPVCVYVDVNLADDPDTAMADAVDTCVKEGRKNATPDALARTAAIGTVEDCVRHIAPLLAAGVTHIAIRPVSQHPQQQVEAIGAALLPELRRELTATGL